MNRPAKPAPPRRKPRKLAPIPAALCRAVTAFGKELYKRYGFQDRPVAERVGRLLRTYITRRRPSGRRSSPAVLKAMELRANGVPWCQVYAQVISGYWDKPKTEQTYQADRLRRAVAARERRRRKRKPNS